MTENRACVVCSGEFTIVKGSRAKFCGEECRRVSTAERNRQWRIDNPDKIKVNRSSHYGRNKANILAYNKQWAADNAEPVRQMRKRYADSHKEERRLYNNDYNFRNKDRLKEVKKKYVEENRQRVRDYAVEYRKKNPDIVARHQRRTLYKDYHGQQPPDICEVCGAGRIIHYDHDHKTGKFRGWLCGNCNWSVGHAKDNPETLRKLADYLDRFNNANSTEP